MDLLDGVNPQQPISFRKLTGSRHQFGSFDLTLSIWDNLNIYGAFTGCQADSQLTAAYERLDLVARNEPIENLSGGQNKVRAEHCCTPKFLFLDKPPGGCVQPETDLGHCKRKQSGPSSFASHNVDEAEKQCDRVLIISRDFDALDTPSA